MKKALSLILVFIFCFVPTRSGAANEVFVGINNAMLPLTDSMPILSGGVWYIDYIDFTRGDLGINVSYNSELGTVVLYNWDITLIFDINKGVAKRGNNEYKQSVIFRNGTIYVPASFSCEQFGFTFSYISDVSTVRIRSFSNMTDSMFLYIAKSRIPDLLDAYNASKPQVTPQPPSTPDKSEPHIDEPLADEPDDPEQKTVYITIDIKNPSNVETIADKLASYNLAATFFISKDAMISSDDTIRRLSVDRHSLGIYANSIEDATLTNNLLYAITKNKSRLLRSDSNISAKESGYRLWGAHVDARTRTASQVITRIDNRTTTVLRLDDSAASISKMNRIFSHVKQDNFTIRTIDVTSTPVNP